MGYFFVFKIHQFRAVLAMSNDYQLPKTLSAFIERLYQAYCCLRGSKPNTKTFNLFFGCMTFGQLNLEINLETQNF